MSDYKTIDLSICPTIACNMSCDFCYIDKRQFSATDVLSFDAIEQVFNSYTIRNLDIYGGEITLLNESYTMRMIEMISKHFNGNVGFVSNGLDVPAHWIDIFKKKSSKVAFSIGNSRAHFDIVERNIKQMHQQHKIDYSIICLDFGEIPFHSDVFKFAKSVSIKPYSKPSHLEVVHQSNMLSILKHLYEQRQDIWRKLELIEKDRDAFEHFFLMPDGILYNVRYNDRGEFFQSLESSQPLNQSKCLQCEFYKKCFNEHYKGYNPDPSGVCIGRKDAMRFLNEIHNIHQAN